jgi:hypothetical protein
MIEIKGKEIAKRGRGNLGLPEFQQFETYIPRNETVGIHVQYL